MFSTRTLFCNVILMRLIPFLVILPFVKHNPFIHFFLLIALCVSQIAVQTHALSHLSAPPQSSHHLDPHHSHTDSLVHSVNGSFHLATENIHADDEFLDCQIYHHYAGLNGVLALPVSALEVPKTSGNSIQINFSPPAKQFSQHKSIRAPPVVS